MAKNRFVLRYLYHKTKRKFLGEILFQGIVPNQPYEWKGLLPRKLQNTPIIWLTETMMSKGCWLIVNTDYLQRLKLHKLKLKDVKWWIYEGEIPPEALERV